MKWSLIALLIGFCMDLILGDPHNIPHPVIWIGNLISGLEKRFRKHFPATVRGEQMAGACLWVVVILLSSGIPAILLMICHGIHPYLHVAVESVMCWQILAVKSLRVESMKVYEALETGTIEDARFAVSMIVGRDTAELDDAAVTRAAVETVAENTSDGIVAPLMYLVIGGAPLGFFYKAINTMDSMLGYVEMPYKHIGLVPAKADDAANYLPARMSAFLMLGAGALLRLDVANGWKMFLRDRYNHASPNSAQTEAVCAGLLGLQLAGDAWYHGVLHKKKWIGNERRPIEHEDIPMICRLSFVTAVLALISFGMMRLAVYRLFHI